MTNDTKLSFEDECFQWASGFYLTEHLPDEWFIEHVPDGYDSFEEYQDHVIESTLWEPFQYWEPKSVCEQIASLANWIENGKYPKKKEKSS